MNLSDYLIKPVQVTGTFPCAGESVKEFSLVKHNLDVLTDTDIRGKKCLLCIFLSVDVAVCADTVREFNRMARKLDNTEILCVSVDTPFALQRFCEREGLDYITVASCFRSASFSSDFGVQLTGSELAGFTARAVICLDEQGQVIHSELIRELARQPDYYSAYLALR
ncbi:Thiol peroxidase, Tpx-type [Photobacterium marinum]|uniref:Thiol peroxidase, Tpx-type n=1 Tax=Photobacterium marinum TaxID=1056511 RepID=L8JA23_9GAMM|nr:thiol peroxidase [Photobacterium marinum]ELR64394.1 Thiol peroxidase, Tpx-type [Photobacterium marinum]